MVRTLAENARLIVATTRVEVSKKYAGSVLGGAWLILQPTLLLSVYLFVYMVVFRLRFPGFSRLDYVLFVFAGLVPFIGSIESITGSTLSVKANIHLVKNVLLPIELIPVRTVLVAVAGEVVGLGLVLLLSIGSWSVTPLVVLLPLAVCVQTAGLLGLAWVVAGLGVALPDVTYFISMFLFLLMFLSPIAFKPDMVPPKLQWVVFANPVYYMLDVFRDCLVAHHGFHLWSWVVFSIISLGSFAVGAAFFKTFKSVLVDFE